MNRPPLQVLVAEDDEDDQILIAEAFERAGADVELRFVDDGVAALDALVEYDARDHGPLVLLDLNMPRMSGHEVLASLREEGPHRRTPVVVLSTSAAAADVETSYRLGANAHCVKPDSFAGLTQMMDDLHAFWGRQVELPRRAND